MKRIHVEEADLQIEGKSVSEVKACPEGQTVNSPYLQIVLVFVMVLLAEIIEDENIAHVTMIKENRKEKGVKKALVIKEEIITGADTAQALLNTATGNVTDT